MRSTSWATAAFLFFGIQPLSCLFPFSSGRRGSNPPPIAWKAIALPNELLPLLSRFVGKSGLEPLNSEEDRFTVCCNCHYATSPFSMNPLLAQGLHRADEGTRTPDRLITNQLLYQLSYIGFCQLCQTTLFSCFEVAKILLFFQRTNFFFIFCCIFILTHCLSVVLLVEKNVHNPLLPLANCLLQGWK